MEGCTAETCLAYFKCIPQFFHFLNGRDPNLCVKALSRFKLSSRMAEPAYLPWNSLLSDFVFNTGKAKLKGLAMSDWGVDYLLDMVAGIAIGIAIGRKRQRSAEKEKKALNVLMALGVVLLLLGIVVFSIVG